jgi:hypothetical protein
MISPRPGIERWTSDETSLNATLYTIGDCCLNVLQKSGHSTYELSCPAGALIGSGSCPLLAQALKRGCVPRESLPLVPEAGEEQGDWWMIKFQRSE